MEPDQVVATVKELPERYADRVRSQDLDGMRSMAGAGEWSELVSLLVASLAYIHTPVTTSERDELRALLETMGEPTDGLDGLNMAG